MAEGRARRHLGLTLPAFHLVQTITAGNMTIYRLHARGPRHLTSDDLPWPAVVAGS